MLVPSCLEQLGSPLKRAPLPGPWLHTAVADRGTELAFMLRDSVAQQSVGQKGADSLAEPLQPAVAVLQTGAEESEAQGWLALVHLCALSSPRVPLEALQHPAAPAPFPTEVLGMQALCQLGPWDAQENAEQ